MASEMASETADDEAIKTYQYLRIGMVLVVVLLAVSVLYERSRAPCWQPSISAYYYTPVRAILVGGLMAIGLCLIVIKGSTTWEDAALNTAGMFAPIVAVVPTSSAAAKCLWLKPGEATSAESVAANIDNNVTALLIAGFLGLAVTLIIAIAVNRSIHGISQFGERGTRIGLLSAFVLLVAGALLFTFWDDFDTKMHGYAAVAMFAFLAVAVALNAWGHRYTRGLYFWLYAVIAALMVFAAIVIFAVGTRWDHGVLILETIEIAMFAAFWIVQTVEQWSDTTRARASTTNTNDSS